MPLTVNLRHLEAHEVKLEGQLAPQELDIDPRDEIIQVEKPLDYRIEVQQINENLLLEGELQLPLNCQCVRCLKPFRYDLVLKDWTCLVPLEGEEAAPVTNDLVDLTPYVREDILLEFPQHPLCKAECRGLPKPSAGKKQKSGRSTAENASAPAWSALNKLKF